MLAKLIPLIDDVLAAGEIQPPPPPEGAHPVAIPLPVSLGDAGHRSR